MIKKIKEWFELLGIIIAFAFGISIYIDWRKRKNPAINKQIKELEKRKVDKNAFKNKSRSDNIAGIRRLVKRRTNR